MILRIVIFLSSCLFLFVFSSVAFSADWKLVEVRKAQDPTRNDYYVYIDFKGSKRLGNKVRYWQAGLSYSSISSQPSNNEVANNGYKQYFEMDCSRKRLRDVTREDEDHHTNYVTVYPTITWENIRPDSTEEKIFNILCRRR